MTRSSWRQTLVAADCPLSEVVKILDACPEKICLVIDGDERLLGTVTDGDVRRGLIHGLTIESEVRKVMRVEFKSADANDAKSQIQETMKENFVKQLPILDAKSRIVDLAMVDGFLTKIQKHDNWIVLMAGGQGQRLRPMTSDLPKPLLKIGDRPLLETIMKTFAEYNFHRFFVSVNYHAEKIKDHFGNGEQWGIEIQYLEEDEQLGTAGALSLIPKGIINEPIIVMNGDVLTKVNFDNLLDFHHEQNMQATMCVREYGLQIPFGVVNIESHAVTAIEEKPTYTAFINAGIYVLEPDLLTHADPDTRTDMTELLSRVIRNGGDVAAFPIREYWKDIGKVDDFNQANWDFSEIFG